MQYEKVADHVERFLAERDAALTLAYKNRASVIPRRPRLIFKDGRTEKPSRSAGDGLSLSYRVA